MPNKIKLLLEKGKKTDNEIKNDKLNLLINQCLYIENKVKDINIINENSFFMVNKSVKISLIWDFTFIPKKKKKFNS